MSIRSLLSFSLLILTGVTCGLGTTNALDEFRRIKSVELTSMRLEALRGLSSIPATLNPERALITLLVGKVAPGDTSQDQIAVDFGHETGVAMARAEAAVTKLAANDDSAAPLVPAVKHIVASWTEARKNALDLVAHASLDKRGNTVSALTDLNSQINRGIIDAMRQQALLIAAVDGTAYRFADIASTVWDLRDAGGRQAGLLQNFVVAGKPVSDVDQRAIVKLEGQVQQVWAKLLPLMAMPSTPAKLKQTLEVVKANYIEEFGATKTQLAENYVTGDFKVDGGKFREATVPMWAKVIAVRDAAYDGAGDALAIADSLAHMRLLFAALALVATLAVSGGIFALIYIRVSRPITRITHSMRRIADGHPAELIPEFSRQDEISEMAGALRVFQANAVRSAALEAESTNTRAEAERRRQDMLADLIKGFEASVGGIVAKVLSDARHLQAAATTMSGSVLDTSRQSHAVASAAETASGNVTVVAATAEELGATVREIGRRMEQSAAISKAAVGEANATASIVKELAQGADKISDVLSLISTIASQTNLLALNATIEAARAGEQGRGFAVVASEVKELANQTAKATAEISVQIGEIQSVTDRAVSAIGAIASTIRQMNEMAVSINASVNQQDAATQDIVRNIAQASNGTGEVTGRISSVANTLEKTGVTAGEVMSSCTELVSEANQLRIQVDRFIEIVRAA